MSEMKVNSENFVDYDSGLSPEEQRQRQLEKLVEVKVTAMYKKLLDEHKANVTLLVNQALTNADASYNLSQEAKNIVEKLSAKHEDDMKAVTAEFGISKLGEGEKFTLEPNMIAFAIAGADGQPFSYHKNDGTTITEVMGTSFIIASPTNSTIDSWTTDEGLANYYRVAVTSRKDMEGSVLSTTRNDLLIRGAYIVNNSSYNCYIYYFKKGSETK